MSRVQRRFLALVRFCAGHRADTGLSRTATDGTQAQEKQRRRPFLLPGSLGLDVRLGVRMLVKYPGLTLVGAFGIAVTVAIAAGGFSVIYGNFLAPSLPLEEGNRIVSIELWDSGASRPERRVLHDYQIWREELKSIREMGAFRTAVVNLIAPGTQPESVRVAQISASGFRVARVQPLIGRYLVEADERAGAPPVIVIGETIWRNRFGRNPAILGETLQLGATPHTVVGVMPDSFAFPVNHRLWVPLRVGFAAAEPLTGPELMVFGRLAPDATLETAQAELATSSRRASLTFPRVYAQLRGQVMPYANPFLGIHQASDVTGLHLMNGIIVLLLVLVCLNVAILMYTRTAMRQAEISVRTALGASRGRIVTQLFIEALVLSALGAVAGVAIAEFALRQVAVATRDIAAELPFWLSFHVSPEAVLYAVGLSVLAAAIVGVIPALQATRPGIHTHARVVGAASAGMRLGGTWTALVVVQVGFAVALLPAAMLATWENLRAELVDPGFAPEEFLSAELDIDSAADPQGIARRYAGQHGEFMRRLQAEPGVASATFAMALPGDEPSASVETQGAPIAVSGSGAKPDNFAGEAAGMSKYGVRFNQVDIQFFRSLNVPILAGRGFEPADLGPAASGSGQAPQGGSVIINQSLALRAFGGDALGQRIRYAAPANGEPGRWYEIVGVVRDFPAGVSPGMNDSPLKVYHAAASENLHPVVIAIRVRGDSPASFTRRLHEVAANVDPDLRLRKVVSLDEALRSEQWLRRLEAGVLASISLSVLLLSSAGIYALMSFTVSQRRKEIGIRMALGADRTRIVASIFSRALGQLATGAVVGAILATLLEMMPAGHRVRENSGVVLTAVVLCMMAVGLLAALGPARRCLGIEPTEALREQ